MAAVRELYGTVVNEGANRVYLATTSQFGAEATTLLRVSQYIDRW